MKDGCRVAWVKKNFVIMVAQKAKRKKMAISISVGGRTALSTKLVSLIRKKILAIIRKGRIRGKPSNG